MTRSTPPRLSRNLFGAVLLCLAAIAQAQPDSATCPPDCTVQIRIPDNPGTPPQAWPGVVTTSAGAQITFSTDEPALIIFSDQGTPFVNPAGQPVYRFNINRQSGRSLLIRSDANPCVVAPGCKYDVVDPNNSERPPLDPYIIIQ
ncbi:MAG: hypothetical protein RQ729_07770 [Wenzhouxiangellaceae bacterium]|nr:hypothetical protein [Wenzhouxiangellaceae bacterium]